MKNVLKIVVISCSFNLFSTAKANICDDLLKKVEQNDFEVSRPLAEYNTYFHNKLRPYLKKLVGSRKIWLDMGAGKASAQIDYLYSASNPATCVALAYKFPSSLPLERYKTFRAIEGLQTPDTIRRLPRADLITDVMGILTYVDNPEEYLLAYIDRLLPGGKLMVYTYSSSSEHFTRVILETKMMVSNTRNAASGLIFTKL